MPAASISTSMRVRSATTRGERTRVERTAASARKPITKSGTSGVPAGRPRPREIAKPKTSGGEQRDARELDERADLERDRRDAGRRPDDLRDLVDGRARPDAVVGHVEADRRAQERRGRPSPPCRARSRVASANAASSRIRLADRFHGHDRGGAADARAGRDQQRRAGPRRRAGGPSRSVAANVRTMLPDDHDDRAQAEIADRAEAQPDAQQRDADAQDPPRRDADARIERRSHEPAVRDSAPSASAQISALVPRRSPGCDR